MKKTYLAAMILVMGLMLTACQSKIRPHKTHTITTEIAVVENQLSKGILIAFTPNTKHVAEEITEDSDSSFDIEAVARTIEKITGGMVIDMGSSEKLPEDYGTIFLDISGSSELSEPLRAFLEKNNLAEKTIIPFGIVEKTDLEVILETLYELNPESEFLEGFSIKKNNSADQQSEVNEWLSTLGYHD